MAELQVRSIYNTHTHTLLSDMRKYNQFNRHMEIRMLDLIDFCVVGVGCLSFFPVVGDFLGSGKGWVLTAAKEITFIELYCTCGVLQLCSCEDAPQNPCPVVPLTFLHSSGFPEVHS